jgi:Ca2+-binding EF-hand superfamily protein
MLNVAFDTPSTTCAPTAPPTPRTLRRTALYRARSFTGDRGQERKLLDAIESCDLDGDGLVSFAELKVFLHSIGWRGKDAYIADLLRQLDVNKDGSVTVAECVACAGILRSLWALRGDRVRAASADSHFVIFLGGSCNPTTWRKDVAIPLFEAAGISDYYNPQVDHWTPDLVQKEAIAKASADILFFVVDNQTRAIASMIEVAEHVAYAETSAKRVVVVIKDVEEGAVMNGELIDATQRDDLNRARAYLADVMRRYPRGSRVCATIAEGAQLCATIHAELVAAAASPAAPRSVVPPLPPTSDGGAGSRGGAPLRFIEAIKACDVDGDGFLSRDELKGFLVSIGWIGDDHELSSLLARIHLGVDEMSTVTIAECVACAEMLQTWWVDRDMSSSASGSMDVAIAISNRPIFLGGSCNPTTWRLDVTIPQFEAAGIGSEQCVKRRRRRRPSLSLSLSLFLSHSLTPTPLRLHPPTTNAVRRAATSTLKSPSGRRILYRKKPR